MVLHYLGTSAAEGWPALFCGCEGCRRARERGGRNLRTRSQALLNGEILLDFPADTGTRHIEGRLDLCKIRHCLITHSHSDHLYAGDIEMIRKGFAQPAEESPFVIYATEKAGESVREAIDRSNLASDGRALFQPVTPLETFRIGRYSVTPLPADHDPQSGPVIYLINDGERGLLYAHDTGYFPDETWRWLETRRPRIDLVSLDCCFGPLRSRRGHMGIEANKEVCDRLREAGCIDGDTVVYTNHFSHNVGAIYDDMVPIAEKYGFLVAYDGCEVTV